MHLFFNLLCYKLWWTKPSSSFNSWSILSNKGSFCNSCDAFFIFSGTFNCGNLGNLYALQSQYTWMLFQSQAVHKPWPVDFVIVDILLTSACSSAVNMYDRVFTQYSLINMHELTSDLGLKWSNWASIMETCQRCQVDLMTFQFDACCILKSFSFWGVFFHTPESWC